MEQIMIRLRDLYFGYHPSLPVFSGLNLEIGRGLTLLKGPNGSGKSTLMKIAAGIERPDRGTAEIEGFDLWKDEVAARMNLAYVPEQPELTPYATISDVLYLVCRLREQPLRVVPEILKRAGLEKEGRRSIRQLSLGQKRRAVLAAAWIGNPRVVLLDDPLESLDRDMRRQVLDWIDGLIERKAAVVIATHEMEVFSEKASRSITMDELES
jgi:ABC-type multidrug transport system ATPase subunit